jgi:hypothetical protein
MKRSVSLGARVWTFGLVGLVILLGADRRAYGGPTWSVLYDQPDAVIAATRSLCGLALSPDDSIFYTGWLHGATSRAVYSHDASSGAILNQYSLGSIQANALATDDRGYVYIGYGVNGGAQMEIRDGTLATQVAAPFSGGASTDYVEGLDILKTSSGTYYLYVSRSNDVNPTGVIERYDVSDPSSPVLDTSWTPGGTYTVTGSGHLRGLKVAADGTIFVTQRDNNTTPVEDREGTVYRITASFVQTSVPVRGAMDVTICDDLLYIPQYLGKSSAICILDASDLSYETTLLTGIDRDVDDWGYSAIEVTADSRLFVNDQWYEVAVNSKGKNYLFSDRVLTSTQLVPEPAMLVLLGLGAAGIVGFRSRRRWAEDQGLPASGGLTVQRGRAVR